MEVALMAGGVHRSSRCHGSSWGWSQRAGSGRALPAIAGAPVGAVVKNEAWSLVCSSYL